MPSMSSSKGASSEGRVSARPGSGEGAVAADGTDATKGVDPVDAADEFIVTGGDDAAALSARAAALSAARLPTRIGLALVGEDFEGARDLILRSLDEAPGVPMSTQLRWFRALPERMLVETTALRSHAAVVAAYEQRFDLSQRWLEGDGLGDPDTVEALGVLTMQLVLAGDLVGLAPVAARFFDAVTESSSLWSLAHAALVGAHMASARPQDALTAMMRMFRPVASTPDSLLEVQAAARPVAVRLLLASGYPRQARAALMEMRLWLADAPVRCTGLAPERWADAMLALAEGNAARAAAWDVAPESSEALGLPFFELWMLLDFAEARVRVGDEEGARQALFRAEALLVRSRDPGWFDARFAELAVPFGLVPPARPRAVTPAILRAGLSEREAEVLEALDSELSSAEIARKLFISPNTLKAHIKSIYRKLGVSSRLSAVRAAHGE